jgi:Na+-transporting NADH:ubiquinone oxidoreductase subunit NqrC
MLGVAACIFSLLIAILISTEKVLAVVFILGLACSIIGGAKSCLAAKDEARDLRARTASMTNTVTTIDTPIWDEKGKCTQIFHLEYLTDALQADCNKFVWNSSMEPPKVGDMVKVKFLRPKESEPQGKMYVLEFQNLTQEIERARGTPESPAPEARPITPEAPAKSRSATRPAPRLE